MIAENLLKVGSDIQNINAKMGENLGVLKTANSKSEHHNKPFDEIISSENTLRKEIEITKKELETAKKESVSYRNSYELMIECVDEKDKKNRKINGK